MLTPTKTLAPAAPAVPDIPLLRKLPVLSIRQPWAWAIIHAGKDIENRSWPTQFRGRFLIHAGKTCTAEEYDDASCFIDSVVPGIVIPPLKDLPRGGIVGMAEIVGCVDESESDWFVGEHGFVIRNAVALPFIPCRGMLGFFMMKEAA